MAAHALGMQIKQGAPDIAERLEGLGYDVKAKGMPQPDVAGFAFSNAGF